MPHVPPRPPVERQPPRPVELVNGPQDGGRVMVPAAFPIVIYVQYTPQGDGFAAWGREESNRFPSRYAFDGSRFRYQPEGAEADWGFHESPIIGLPIFIFLVGIAAAALYAAAVWFSVLAR